MKTLVRHSERSEESKGAVEPNGQLGSCAALRMTGGVGWVFIRVHQCNPWLKGSAVDLAENDVDGAEDDDGVGDGPAEAQFLEEGEVDEGGRADPVTPRVG